MASVWATLRLGGGRCTRPRLTGRRPVPPPGPAGTRLYSGAASLPKTTSDPTGTEEEIVIPKRKTWDKLAVLQALASTVNRDPTAAHYAFQDDPFLIPTSSNESRLFLLAKESGKKAAQYVIRTYPKFFEKDIADPHIPCLMPEYFGLHVEPQIEEISEAALQERVQLRKVKASVDMFDQLLQAGTPVSLETANQLLDLLCFYGDQEPPREGQPRQSEELGEAITQEEDPEEENETTSRRRGVGQFGMSWRANNNAERIFSLMPEKNAHSYCTLIRGMVKYRAHKKAFDMYTDLSNDRLRADVHAFNALIEAAATVKDLHEEKWALMVDLLKQMAAQKVKPNLQTFNTILKTLKKFGMAGRIPALQTLNEMKAVNIEPSLATYYHLLEIFYKHIPSTKGPAPMIYEIMNEIQGKRFFPQDLDDDKFFQAAMRVCFSLKDLELAYQVHDLMRTGDNWKFIGNDSQRVFYYGKFFGLLCLMEQLDVTLKWYKELIPSVYFPHAQAIVDLLQALDMGSQLDMIPQIWKDSKGFGVSGRAEVKEEILELMARDKHPPELQALFADCAADIKSTHENQDGGRGPSEWTARSLSNIAILFLRAGRTQEAWKMLGLFKKQNRIPRSELLNEFLDSAKEHNNPSQAVEVVQLAGALILPIHEALAQRVMSDFPLSEEQKKILEGLRADSDSDSDSDED
ncbi:pentatricopeptide repeat domain-containing protein 3, mitochondrial [Ornithorhynchus anatinus]|uniref:Small ribosomal subunit protein mS39 n=1 Tax=Ornithorhynchus anatinus TaxID=9258 RepID=F7F7W4_ORNAN|nr:pentatricopeptide repeat domain-containing protein 3, mitochondrial [Ornithorhynchus anatinus]